MFAYPIVFTLAGRSIESYGKPYFFSIFERLGPFPHIFGKLKEWLILGLHEMIKVPHLVAWPLDFNLVCD